MEETKKSDKTVAKEFDEDPATKRLRRTKDMLPGQYPGKEFYGGGETPAAAWDDGRNPAALGRGTAASSAVFQRSRSDRFSDLGDDKDRIPKPENE